MLGEVETLVWPPQGRIRGIGGHEETKQNICTGHLCVVSLATSSSFISSPFPHTHTHVHAMVGVSSKSVVVAVGVLVFAVVPLVAWVAYELYWKMHCQVPPHCTGTF